MCQHERQDRRQVRAYGYWRAITMGMVLVLNGPLVENSPAQDVVADSDPGSVLDFNIPPQSLGSALNAFAVSSGWQISSSSELTGGMDSVGLSGKHTREKGLQTLLSGTGLTYRVEGERMITIERGSLPPVSTAVGVPVAAASSATGNGVSAPVQNGQKPVKVPEIVVKDVRERQSAASYVAESTNTATKSDIPLLETPQSISVITRRRMVDQEVNSIGEALRYTPGVQGEPNGFDSRLTWLRFRGFDNTTNGLFKDGLQLRNPAFGVTYNLEPYGAEQLDVLRGPASFLYGQGSAGGLLNYVSKRPTQESLHEVQFLSGSFGRNEGRFDFSGLVNDSDTFSYRLTGLFRESGTQVDNVFNDRVYIAPSLTWRLAPSTSVTFFATYQKDRAGAFQFLPPQGTYLSNPNGIVQPNRFLGQPPVDHYNRTEHSIGYEFQHQLSDNWKFLQKMRYNSNETDSVTTYLAELDTDLRTGLRSQWTNFGKLNAVALDNQLSGKLSTGPFQHVVLAGIDFQRISVEHNQNFSDASSVDVFNRYDYGALGVVTPGFDSRQQTTQLQTGLYVQDQVRYDKWLLTLGGRHDWAKNETLDNVAGTTSTQNDRKATGRAALTYVFDVGLAPYVSYSTFFLPSIGLDANGKQFKAETGSQYELGIKYQPPGSRSFVAAALFDLTRENYLQTDPGTFLPVQRGKARSRGLELEGVASFDSGVDLIAAYTFLDNEVLETVDPVEQGKRLVQTPSQFGSLWVKYTVPGGSFKGLGIGGGARYTGITHADVGNAFRVPGFVVGDAVIDYTWNHYRFALNVNNILNHDAFACFNEGLSCNYGERRTVVGTVAYRW